MNYFIFKADNLPRYPNGIPMNMDPLLKLFGVTPEQVVNISPLNYRYFQDGSISVDSYIVFYRTL